MGRWDAAIVAAARAGTSPAKAQSERAGGDVRIDACSNVGAECEVLGLELAAGVHGA